MAEFDPTAWDLVPYVVLMLSKYQKKEQLPSSRPNI